MPLRLSLFLLLFSSSSVTFWVNAQSRFDTIDARSIAVPDSLQTCADITAYLTRDLKTETEKLRAIYVWVTHNISYDFSDTSPAQNSNLVVQKRSGVCRHYSLLFNDMCAHAGIQSFIISGYTKSYKNKIADRSHAWNLVLVNDSFSFIDATWGAGFADDDRRFVSAFDDDYFMKSPERFIKNHMPFDPIWQCLSGPVSNYEFLKPSRFITVKRGSWNFRDSITAYLLQDTVTKLSRSNDRIISQGVTNTLISEEISTNDKNIALYKENKTIASYNKAVEHYNAANKSYAVYLKYKQRRFLEKPVPFSPVLPDSIIRQLLALPLTDFRRGSAIMESLLANNEYQTNLKERLKEQLLLAEKELISLNKFLNKGAFGRFFTRL